MSGANLAEASFVKAQAQKANFDTRTVSLGSAKFGSANLSEASFIVAQAQKADFSKSNVERS
jgi:uncharacterized protein YjbI with pentapeptide repeats